MHTPARTFFLFVDFLYGDFQWEIIKSQQVHHLHLFVHVCVYLVQVIPNRKMRIEHKVFLVSDDVTSWSIHWCPRRETSKDCPFNEETFSFSSTLAFLIQEENKPFVDVILLGRPFLYVENKNCCNFHFPSFSLVTPPLSLVSRSPLPCHPSLIQ